MALRVVWALVLLALLASVGHYTFYYPRAAGEGVQILLTGWVTLPRSTLVRVSPDWSAIGMAVICSGLALATMHRIGRRLTRTRQLAWSWRSSAAAFLAIGWLFILSVVTAGLGRSTYSLLLGPESSVTPVAPALPDLVQTP